MFGESVHALKDYTCGFHKNFVGNSPSQINNKVKRRQFKSILEKMASGGPSANLKGEGPAGSRQQAAAAIPYNWYDPAPVNCRFPWMNLNLPWVPCEPVSLIASYSYEPGLV